MLRSRLSWICMCACLGSMVLGCSEDGSLFHSCQIGAQRCQNGNLQVCAAVQWETLTQCPLGCNEDSSFCAIPSAWDCVVDLCKDSSTLNSCKDGVITEVPCGEGHYCNEMKAACEKSEDIAQGDCQPYAVKCGDDGLSVQTCGTNMKWGDAVPCDTNQICDATQNACVPKNDDGGNTDTPCRAGALQCNSDHTGLQTCGDDGKWGDAVFCDEGTACSSTTLRCAESCTPKTTRCAADGVNIQTCLDTGFWGKKNACPLNRACTNDACPETCSVGSKSCNDDNTASQICNEDGILVETPCDEGQSCLDGACVEQGKECLKDGIKCASTTSYYTCNDDGKWNAEAVSNGITDDVICFGNALVSKCQDTCVGDLIQRCDTSLNQLKAAELCDVGQYCQTMSNGTVACDVPHCNPKTAQTSCIEGDESLYMGCDETTLTMKSIACPDGKFCDNTAQACKTPACQKGEFSCLSDNKSYVECDETTHTWLDDSVAENVKQCEDNLVCSNGACAPTCQTNQRQCIANDSATQRCLEDGVWGNDAGVAGEMNACNHGEKCFEGDCLCDEIDKSYCKDDTARRVCGQGHLWGEEIPCEFGCDTKSGQCYECSGTASHCDENGNFQVCIDHAWTTLEACGDSCSTSGCSCTEGQTHCSEDKNEIVECTLKSQAGVSYTAWTTRKCDSGCYENNLDGTDAYCGCTASHCDENGNFWLCSNAQLKLYASCDQDETCSVEKQGCLCTPGSRKCDGNQYKICSNDQMWSSSNACTACSDELGSVCVSPICEEGDKYCHENTIMVCKNGTFVESQTCSGSNFCSESIGITTGTKTVECTASSNNDCDLLGNLASNMRCSANGQSTEKCTNVGSIFNTTYEWEAQTQCDENSICVESYRQTTLLNSTYYTTTASCVAKVCTDFDMKCGDAENNANQIQICFNNQWLNVADCAASGGLVCKDAYCVNP